MVTTRIYLQSPAAVNKMGTVLVEKRDVRIVAVERGDFGTK